MSYRGYRTGFPFRIHDKNEIGEPFGIWDGVTYFETFPSASSERGITVVGPGTENPLGFSFAEVMVFVWRLKTIRFSFDVTISAERTFIDENQSRTQHHQNSDIVITRGAGGIESSIDPDSIKEWICLQSWGLGQSIYTNPTTYGTYDWEDFIEGESSDSGSSSDTISFRLDNAYQMILASDGLYYPKISASIRAYELTSSRRYGGPSFYFEPVAAVLKITGCPDIPLFSLGIDGYSYKDNIAATGSINFDLDSYWSHNGKWNPADGTPI